MHRVKGQSARRAILLCCVGVASAGFDWGTGCAGGSGEFTTSLDKGETLEVGNVPEGLWNVQVLLTATTDVDVQLYDAERTEKWADGQAIVAWVEDPATENGGVLGSSEGEESSTYQGMSVTYSGYGGVAGQPGKEFIRVTGEATTRLSLSAFAFEAGDAVVSLSLIHI